MSEEGTEQTHALPAYAQMMADYHEAFADELDGVIDALGVDPGSSVVDLACGDGAYTKRLARRVGDSGVVLALDLSSAFLDRARSGLEEDALRDRTRFVQMDVEHSPVVEGNADLVWCAQSLYSLPDPSSAVRRMAALARPGGRIAVFESDEFHHVTLPWPVELEMALRREELRAFEERSDRPEKYYIARDLPRIFREAGLPGCAFLSFAFSRRAPFDRPTRGFLAAYLADLDKRVAHRLAEADRREFQALVDPASPRHILDDADSLVVCVDHLAIATRPD